MKTSELIGPALDWAVAKCENEVDTSWWNPSSDWSQSGPIIERERITIRFWENEEFVSAYGRPGTEWMHGPTALIAAMRCYVASKLGGEVEIPDELV